MTAPDPYATPAPTTDRAAQADGSRSSLLRAAIWVAIGALIAAAIVCVLWVLLGSRTRTTSSAAPS